MHHTPLSNTRNPYPIFEMQTMAPKPLNVAQNTKITCKNGVVFFRKSAVILDINLWSHTQNIFIYVGINVIDV